MSAINLTRVSLAETGTPLYTYLLEHQPPEHAALQRLRATTLGMERDFMQIAPDQGHFMAFLVKALGARRILELGTFTGYSALAMSLALPGDGQLVTCDVNDAWASVGRPYWEEAGVAGKIDLRIGPALETLRSLEQSDGAGSFDLVFVDADKANYGNYYEAALRLVHAGGVIILDNMLYLGRVIDHENHDPGTAAIRELNDRIAMDERVDRVMLPISDGVTLVRRR